MGRSGSRASTPRFAGGGGRQCGPLPAPGGRRPPARRSRPAPRYQHPFGVVVAPDGSIYVTDLNAEQLVRVDPTTRHQATIPVSLPLDDPFDLALQPDGNLLLADRAVDVPGVMASFTGSIPPPAPRRWSPQAPPFADPRGVAVQADGQILVADEDAGRQLGRPVPRRPRHRGPYPCLGGPAAGPPERGGGGTAAVRWKGGDDVGSPAADTPRVPPSLT